MGGPSHRPRSSGPCPALPRTRAEQDGSIHAPKMAAAMDVDTPSGTNSGAGKKRFEVKKVRPRRRALPAAPGGTGWGWGRPDAGKRDGEGGDFPLPSRSRAPSSAAERRKGGARPSGSPGVRPSQWLRLPAARAGGAGQSAGAAGGGGSRSRGRREGRAGPGMPCSALCRSLPSDAAAPTGIGCSISRAAGQLGPASSAGVLPPPDHPGRCGPDAPAAPCAA